MKKLVFMYWNSFGLFQFDNYYMGNATTRKKLIKKSTQYMWNLNIWFIKLIIKNYTKAYDKPNVK
jgi:hypothetical protein